jgi:hypothetical protein
MSAIGLGKKGINMEMRMRMGLANLMCVAAMMAMMLGPAVALAAGNTWLVNNLAYGDDTQCNLAVRHCKTIQAAVTAAEPGDTINVAAGTYSESLSISKPLTLKATAGAASTILNGGDPYSVFITSRDVTVDGFTITNPGYSGRSDASGVVVEPSPYGVDSHVRITNNVIHDIGTPGRTSVSYGNCGINIGFADGVEIDHNEIYNIIHSDPNAWANGICIWGGGPDTPANNISIHDNSFHDISSPYPADAAISTQTDVGSVTVHNNSFVSTLDHPTEYAVEVRSTNTVDATYNWWDSPNGACKPAAQPGCIGLGGKVTDNVTVDPFTALTLEVGEDGTLNTQVTANGVYGAQLVVDHNNSILNFVSGVANPVASNPPWAWDWLVKSFTHPVPGTTELAGTMKERSAGANLTGQSIATWTYKCVGLGISTLSYDTTPLTGTLLSDKDGFKVSSVFAGDSIYCVAATSAVDGFIGLQGRLKGSLFPTGWLSSTVTLACTGGACSGSGPYVMVTDAQGYYQRVKTGAGTGIGNGTYTAVVTRRGYLPATKTAIPVSGSAVTLSLASDPQIPTLLGGDVDDSGTIDITDLSTVGSAFGQVPGGGADTGADINGDNIVNIFDLVLAGGNFNASISPW